MRVAKARKGSDLFVLNVLQWGSAMALEGGEAKNHDCDLSFELVCLVQYILEGSVL